MKRLIFLIDGTWANSEADPPSNVVRLAQRISRTDNATGCKQIVLYHRGVGTGYGTGHLARFIDRYMGGALGWGGETIVEECYRQLVLNYEAGDEIFLFGWSRGAHIARRIADVVRNVGLLDVNNVRSVKTSVFREISRNDAQDTHPSHPASFEYRALKSPLFATGHAEQQWRIKSGRGHVDLLTINYIGLWDCVSAVTLPINMGLRQGRRSGMQAHDANMSAFVKSARHAVSLDERSKLFSPELFDNFEALDMGRAVDQGQFDQCWFPGNHADVGGKSDRNDLGAATFDFIADGAVRAGLSLKWAPMDTQFDPMQSSRKSSSLRQRVFASDRKGPSTLDELTPFTLRYLAENPGYRPQSLESVLEDIESSR